MMCAVDVVVLILSTSWATCAERHQLVLRQVDLQVWHWLSILAAELTVLLVPQELPDSFKML